MGVNKKLQKLGIFQGVLQTLNAKFQNTKIGSTIYSNEGVVFLYFIYKFNNWWRTIIRVILQTTSNLLMRLIFATLGVIRVRARKIRFSTL